MLDTFVVKHRYHTYFGTSIGSNLRHAGEGYLQGVFQITVTIGGSPVLPCRSRFDVFGREFKSDLGVVYQLLAVEVP